MKYAKMLGLAVVAAMALMAFAGAGTASAVLCKTNQKPCEAANQYPVHSTIKAHSASAVLTGSLEVTCESDVTMLEEEIKNGKLFGKITSLTWSNCKGGCSSAATNTPLPTFEDEAVGGGNGRAFIFNTSVTLKGCFFFFTCVAKASKAELSLTGGTIGGTAAATATNVKTEVSGEGCGTAGTWNAKYTITEVNGSKTGSIFLE